MWRAGITLGTFSGDSRSATASAMVSVNGTQTSTVDFAALGSQSSIPFVKRCLLSTHSTCEPRAAIGAVIVGSGDAAKVPSINCSLGAAVITGNSVEGGREDA